MTTACWNHAKIAVLGHVAHFEAVLNMKFLLNYFPVMKFLSSYYEAQLVSQQIWHTKPKDIPRLSSTMLKLKTEKLMNIRYTISNN